MLNRSYQYARRDSGKAPADGARHALNAKMVAFGAGRRPDHLVVRRAEGSLQSAPATFHHSRGCCTGLMQRAWIGVSRFYSSIKGIERHLQRGRGGGVIQVQRGFHANIVAERP